MSENTKTANDGISRRTVTKAMAWSVPAIAIAAPIPAFAASGSGPTATVISGGKIPGGSCTKDYGFTKDYVFVIKLYNSSSTKTVYAYQGTTLGGATTPVFNVSDANGGIVFTFNNARLFTLPGTISTSPLPTAISLAPLETKYIIVNAGPQGNSAFTTLSGTIYFAWGHSSTPGADLDHPYTPVPPAANFGSGWFGGSFSGMAMNPTQPNCYPSA